MDYIPGDGMATMYDIRNVSPWNDYLLHDLPDNLDTLTFERGFKNYGGDGVSAGHLVDSGEGSGFTGGAESIISELLKDTVHAESPSLEVAALALTYYGAKAGLGDRPKKSRVSVVPTDPVSFARNVFTEQRERTWGNGLQGDIVLGLFGDGTLESLREVGLAVLSGVEDLGIGHQNTFHPSDINGPDYIVSVGKLSVIALGIEGPMPQAHGGQFLHDACAAFRMAARNRSSYATENSDVAAQNVIRMFTPRRANRRDGNRPPTDAGM